MTDFVRGRRARDFTRERVLMGEGEGGASQSRDRVREGENTRTWGRETIEAAERRVRDMTGAVDQTVQVHSVPKNLDDEDEISELELDGGVAVGIQQVEHESRVERRPAVIAGEERGTNQEEEWRFRGSRVTDHCTQGERLMVEDWIAACERARCKGFVKRVRGRTDSDERFEDAVKAEGEVNVRGGRGRVGWPEWGLRWGASRHEVGN